jgi:cysteine-rich repeat protein
MLEGTEECDDGNLNDGDACLSTCRSARCGDGVVRTGVEQCDGSDAPCAGGNVCAADCVCRPPGDACTTTVVTVRLATPAPLGSGTLVVDYPETAVAIPGSGNAASVRARVAVLTSTPLFSGGAPNDQDDRILFTLFASEGLASGPLLAVTFDCLGTPPLPAAFTCGVSEASTPGLTPIVGASCTLTVESRRE